MNVGRLITQACREQRFRDLYVLTRGRSTDDWDRLKAYCWWGWDIQGHGGLGYPGSQVGTFPARPRYWSTYPNVGKQR